MRKYTFILFLIIIFGLILRLYNITNYSLWYDETFTLQLIKGQFASKVYDKEIFDNILAQETNNLKGVVESTLKDYGNALSWNVFFHYWSNVFGTSDLALRSLSIIFGLLIIIAAYRLSLDLYDNKKLALLVSFIVALHPVLIGASQQARGYNMATLFGLLSTHMLFKIIHHNLNHIKYFVFYTFFILVLLTTHYLSACIYMAHFIIFLLYVRKRETWKKYIFSNLIVALVFFGWMSTKNFEGFRMMKAQNEHWAHISKNHEIHEKTPALPATVGNMAGAMVQNWLHVFNNGLQNMGLRIRTIAILLLLPLLVILYAYQTIKNRKEQKNIFISLLIIIFTQTLFTIPLVIRAGHIFVFQSVYTVFVAPYACLLLGYSLLKFFDISKNKIIPIVITILIAIISLVSLLPIYFKHDNKFPRENIYLKAATNISSKYQRGDTLLIKSVEEARIINIYLPRDKRYIQKIDPTIKSLFFINQ